MIDRILVDKILIFLTWVYVMLGVIAVVLHISKPNNENNPYPHKGQHFDLRGGSTVIEVNPAEKVVWFRCDSDSTYFYEPFANIGIQ
jgi:hypothetical protein